MLGLPFRGADPAVAVTGAPVFEVERMQHAVADEPVRARRLELRIGPVAIERAVEFARQFADDFQKRRVAFHRNRRQIGSLRVGRHLLRHRLLPRYLYIVKMAIQELPMIVKSNLYTVKIKTYKAEMPRK